MESLTFTDSCFMQSKGITSSIAINTQFEVLSSSTSDRRVYGFAVLSDDIVAQTVKIHLNNGVSIMQVCAVSISASSGTNGTIAIADVFSSSTGQSVFQKRVDPNGLAYFNLPAGWSILMEYNTALAVTETITTHIFGEIY